MKHAKHARFGLFAFLAILLCLSLAACGEKEAPPEPDPAPSGDALSAYEGWWYMDENYPEGLHVIEIFTIDSAAGIFTSYDSMRNVVYEGDVWIDDTGALALSMDFLGEFYLTPAQGGLYDEEGMLAFVAGEPLEAPDLSDLAGKWLLNGDPEGDYYELSSDGSYAKVMAATEYSEAYTLEEGNFTLSSMTFMYSVGEPMEGLHITFGDETFADEGNLSPNRSLFQVSDFGDTLIYVHEEALGSSETDAEIAYATFCSSYWKTESETDPSVLTFFHNGCFERSAIVVDGEGWSSYETIGSGQWSLTYGSLHLFWEDGTEEDCEISADEGSFYIASLTATFIHEV